MKILITGSSGMLGSALCGILRGKHYVIGLDVNGPKDKSVAPDVLYDLSLEDRGGLADVLDSEKPDVIIHTAAWTDVDGCEKDPAKAEQINVKCTENVAETVKAFGDVPVIYISTDYVFNGQKGSPYREEDPVSPLNVYGRTKAEAEKVIKDSLGSYIIIRTSWLFGIHGKNFVNTIIEKAGKVKEFKVVDDQVGAPTFSEDLAAAVYEILEKGIFPGQYIFHITNNGYCSWYEFTKKILEIYNRDNKVRVEPVSSDEMDRPAKRPAFSVLDNGLFKKITGTDLRRWTDALETYLNESIQGTKNENN